MILGKQVRLRAIERSDLPRFVRWLNDPEVRRNLVLHIPLSQDQEESWFDLMRKNPLETQPLAIEVETGKDWMHIGNVGFNQLNWNDRSAEVGIFIGEKSLWNHGYGRMALQLLVRHGFNDLNLHRIYLHVYETNLRAIRSYEHAGFIHEGSLRQARYLDGGYVDVLVMSILKDEWQDSEI
jgi:diamine N-acetyltransferase